MHYSQVPVAVCKERKKEKEKKRKDCSAVRVIVI